MLQSNMYVFHAFMSKIDVDTEKNAHKLLNCIDYINR